MSEIGNTNINIFQIGWLNIKCMKCGTMLMDIMDIIDLLLNK